MPLTRASILNTPGKEVAAPATITAAYSSGSIASGAQSTAAISLAVVGDNATPMLIELTAPSVRMTAGTASTFAVYMWDGAIGGTVVANGLWTDTAIGNYMGPLLIRYRAPAFSGTKTFNVSLQNGGALAGTFELTAGVGAPAMLRATWAG